MEKRIELEMRGRPAEQITELNLDNCRSTNIVGLSEEFSNLVKLSLINVGLVTLKGFPKLPSLQKLELSDNRISNGLAYLFDTCPNITNLNLSGNRLKDLEALKPLEKFEQLEVLDLFNNEATSIDNYREKVFALIPSLKYLDGFDLKDGEAPSDGEDDEDANGFNGSDDGLEEDEDAGRFSINGLDIDLVELAELERRVACKRQLVKPAATSSNIPEGATGNETDYLDVYLEQMQLNDTHPRLEDGATADSQSTGVGRPQAKKPLGFFQLLFMFMSIVSIAKLLYYGGEDDLSDDDDEETGEEDYENGDVSLSEVLNEDLDDDSSEWDEDAAEGAGEEDEDDIEEEESDEEAGEKSATAAGKKRESTSDAPATKSEDKDNEDSEEGEEDDESQSKGKKRKHDD